MKKNSIEYQNNFQFLNRPNKIENVHNEKELESSIKLIKKANSIFQQNYGKTNTMFMKLSHNSLKYIKNNVKDTSTTLFELKEDNSSAGLKISNPEDAITKSAINRNKTKEDEYPVKDYFQDDYAEDIFKNIKKDERMNIYDYSSNNLFRLQDTRFINEKSRSRIFQWLVYNNYYLNLNDNTIFMAMNILDRYISKYKVENSEFQLVAISSYLIASKFEDIYAPTVDSLSEICNYIYVNNDIIRKEHEILTRLNFDILYNSSYKYLTCLHSIEEKDNLSLFYLAQFILELSLENVDILAYSQSKRACAALFIAKKIMKITISWNDLKFNYYYNENEIKIIQKKMIILLNNVIKNKIKNAVFMKFATPRYKCVSVVFGDVWDNPSDKKNKNDGPKEKRETYNDEKKPDNI